MTTTTMPPNSDLPWFRIEFQKRIGNPLGDIGVLPDASHKSSGGYHCGSWDLKNIGRGIPPASGKTTDYSARSGSDPSYYQFEISHGSNLASAMDIPGPWNKGGQAGWIRWNNYVVADLRSSPTHIPGLRALNFSPEGTTKKRYDSNNPGQGIISSTDTVLWHTHLEWWRGSVMNRRAGFQRLLDLAEDAIANRPARAIGVAAAPSTLKGHGDVIYTIKETTGWTGTDAIGKAVGNSTRCMLTPAGPVAYEYGEIIDWYNANGGEKSMLPMTWARMHEVCASLGQPQADTVGIVTGVLQGLADDPQVDVSQATVNTIATAVRAKFAADPLK